MLNKLKKYLHKWEIEKYLYCHLSKEEKKLIKKIMESRLTNG